TSAIAWVIASRIATFLQVRGDLLRQVFHGGLERGAEHRVDEWSRRPARIHAQRELQRHRVAADPRGRGERLRCVTAVRQPEEEAGERAEEAPQPPLLRRLGGGLLLAGGGRRGAEDQG